MPRPVLNLTVGSAAYQGTVYSAKIIQPEYGIEAAIITLPRPMVTAALFSNGTPVQLTYGRSPASLTTFSGYIHHIETDRSQQKSVATLVCEGAASPQLRNAANRAWPVNSMAQTAAVAIADALHLSSLTEATDVVAPGGPVRESWWRYLVRMAKECGFTCYTSGTDIRFHSRRVNEKDVAPWFQYYDQAVMQFTNNVVSFNTVASDDIARHSPHRQRRVYGVTDEGLTVEISDSGDLESVGGITQVLPTLTHVEGMVVHDSGTALSRLRGVQESHRFATQSEFVVSGNETVRQSSTIIIRGVDADLDGYWYVLNVVHQLTTAGYSLRVLAGRDGVGDNAPVDLSTPVPLVDLGAREVVAAPAAQLVIPRQTATDLVFAPGRQQWTASTALHRVHTPWRAAIRG